MQPQAGWDLGVGGGQRGPVPPANIKKRLSLRSGNFFVYMHLVLEAGVSEGKFKQAFG